MIRLLQFLAISLYAIISPAQSEIIAADELVLSTDWKFCPQNEFVTDIKVEEQTCYDIQLPGGWESVIPDYDGYAILTTKFNVPKSLTKSQLGFFTNRLRDADKTFINGVAIGETGEFPPHFEKAVFYSRLYAIPLDTLKLDFDNLLVIWVYNDARPGGILYSYPEIGVLQDLNEKYHQRNYIIFALIIILLVFSITNFINYIFNIKSVENLYFGLFLLSWSGYLFSSSNLVLLFDLPLNILFRFNVILFFSIFSLFLLFIYSFFRQPLPIFLKAIISVALLCIPIGLALPEPKHLYYLVELVEILSIPTIFFAFWLMFQAYKSRLSYARAMSIVLILYVLFGITEILLDYFYANEATTYSPIGPWVLLLLSLGLSFIVGHKNMSYYKQATYDGLTGALRFDQFLERLQRLISRGERDRKPIVVLMVDLDDFKNINDKYGHMNGDKVLSLVSHTMRNQLRHFDLLARYGGDEFCIAVMMDNIHDIKQLVTRVHQQVKSLKIHLNGELVNISVTIGATIQNPDGPRSTIESIIETADNLLIKSKANSKGEVLW
jgi:diguanylate cyclase (GGDEF)-like protein